MLKQILLCSALVLPVMATPALAQMQHTEGMQHTDGMNGMQPIAGMDMGDMDMGNMDMAGMDMANMEMEGMEGMAEILEGTAKIIRQMQQMRGMHMGMGTMGMQDTGAPQGVGGSPLSEPGQSAFAAIAEVVNVLNADPNTDWSRVDIDALRNHLRDMDIVTIDSTTVTTEVDGGLRFDVTGSGDVTDAIRRMASAHAGMMNGVDGWAYSTEEIAGGASMTVIVPDSDLDRLKGLGFYGIMAAGMHHQPHHWAMANGGNPHH